ncbi:sodium/potassium-transporting ATPase subunit beta-2-like isoform X1 [Cloeon dipterum]|uniref:sodium/potassium-transporting ATPase subunit beta-2-like isoform X1 n=1 Tax=Cloeon dipterum TaxID=197152 RepID=UPI00321FD395
MPEKTVVHDDPMLIGPPPVIGGWQSFKEFVYNGDKGTIFGRTGLSWAKIGVFYLIFYGILAAMFAAMLLVFFQTLDPRIPRWKLEESLIGTNPGLGYRPMPQEPNLDSSLIWYKGTKPENYEPWTKQLDKFLDVYRRPGLTPGRGQNIHNCDFDNPPPTGKVCEVDVKNWYPCNTENNYDFHKGSPCIFLKLNKIYDWVPDYFNDTANLPDKMPNKLKEHIKNVPQKELNTVWVSCEGENPADIENIGAVDYIPKWGFPGYFYPYENSEGYLSPLVAVHFVAPRTGVLINIECKAWAKNIKHDRADRLGSVHFELMID